MIKEYEKIKVIKKLEYEFQSNTFPFYCPFELLDLMILRVPCTPN